MSIQSDDYFWPRLARAITRRLSLLSDNHLRFLWVDDIIPEDTGDRNGVEGMARVSEDSGHSFEHYDFVLELSEHTSTIFRTGNRVSLLPDPESDVWLAIDRTGRTLKVTLL